MDHKPVKSLPLSAATRRAFATHPRTWADNRYVYAVVSRRSGGISIGINLNPDKVCNFDCIYCSVDRKLPGSARTVSPDILRQELRAMLRLAASGEIFHLKPFADINPELMRINDVAFSGDGEPTACPVFGACCRIAAEELQSAGLATVKIVVITNATMLGRRSVRQALAFLDQHHGEVWAKLDAGTAACYQLVDRPGLPFTRILANIRWCALHRPTVIQTLFMRIDGQPPPAQEIAAYTQRLREICSAGGHIKLVQLYTVARQTTESYVTALSAAELSLIAQQVTAALPEVPVQCFP